MATTARYPSANNGGWDANENYAYADDGAYATESPGTNSTVYVEYGNFGFDSTIPSGATINSVTIELQWKVSTTASTATLRVDALVSNSAVGTQHSDTSEPTSDKTTSYANNYASWTRDALLDGVFEVRVGAQKGTGATGYTMSLDYVKVTVDYTEAATGTDASSERDLYTRGKLTNSSERDVYTRGKLTNSSERAIYTKGVATSSSERVVYTRGKLSSSSERSLYTEGEAAVENWLTGWDYRVKVTVKASEVDADCNDFPVYVDLNDLPAGFHTNVNQTDARDIRVTTSDGETEVPREVVFYTAASDTGELHFKGNISASTDTDFYIYYGNSSATEPAVTATYGRNNVWSDYQGVWHLNETVNTSTDGYVDVTGNGNDGTGVSMALTAPDGQLSGKSQEFDGSADYISGGDVLDLGTNDMTIQSWAYTDEVDASNSQFIVSKALAAGQNYRYGVRVGAGSSYFGLFFQGNGGSDVIVTGTTNVIGSWHLGHFVYDRSGNATVYTDGTDAQTGAISQWDSLDFQSSNPFRIGAYTASDNTSIYAPFDGKLDEVRIRFGVLTATWISTEYNNQYSPSTFFTIGSQEEPSAGTEASSERSVYTKAKATSSSERNIYTKGVLTSSSERSIYSEGSATAAFSRDIYSKGVANFSSTKDIYIIGKALDSSERNTYTKGVDTGYSERGIHTIGSIDSSSERGIYTEGGSGAVQDSSERLVYTKGSVTSDSQRGIYTKGILTGSSERDIYTEGYDSSSSIRSIHSIGGGITSSERSTYTIGGVDSSSIRSLYISGIATSSSEKNIFTTSSLTGSSNRGVYTKGYVTTGSERDVYTVGNDSSNSERSLYTEGTLAPEQTGSERGLYTVGRILSSSERNIHTPGMGSLCTDYFIISFGSSQGQGTSQRGIYTKADLTGSSNRGIYSIGGGITSSERSIYSVGGGVVSSERNIYSVGGGVVNSQRQIHTTAEALGTSQRGVYTEGATVGSSSRGIYSKGFNSSSSERSIYSEGVSTDSNQRDLYTIGSLSSSSERDIYLTVNGVINSERGIYTEGVSPFYSERTLYTMGISSDNSERSVYTQGSSSSSSDRSLYSIGILGAYSERNIYTIGKDSDSDERSIYTTAILGGSSERGIYTDGIETNSSERYIYSQGGGTNSSERGVYSIGGIKESSERGIHSKGTWRPWVDKSVGYGTIYTDEEVVVGGNFVDLTMSGSNTFTNDSTTSGTWEDKEVSSANNFTRKV